VKYQVKWPDGDVYEEDGETVFTLRRAQRVIKALEGTIAGDATIEPAPEEEL
jgi:hypothetical protein